MQKMQLNILSPFGRPQGSVRALNAEQMSRFRHLLPHPRSMTPHHSFHDGTSATAVQRIASLSPYSPRPLTALQVFPYRGPGVPSDHRPTALGKSNHTYINEYLLTQKYIFKAAVNASLRPNFVHRLQLQPQQQSNVALASINGTRRIAIDSPISLPRLEGQSDETD